jgi:regulator of nonsense transcripts 2
MMSESLESRKLDRRPVFDVALPVRSRPREATATNDQGDGDSEAPAPAPKMAFSVLTKKGNKQQVSSPIMIRESELIVSRLERWNCQPTPTLRLL